jgi:type II secretory pathway component GspD/PulD (secretin)
MKIIKHILTLFVVIILSSCNTQENKQDVNPILYQKLIEDHYHKPFKAPDKTPVYVVSNTLKNDKLNKKIQIATTGITLTEAITFAGDFTIMSDADVDLAQEIPVLKINSTLENYLNLLENITGYSINLKNDNIIEVNALISKNWNLATLSSNPDSIKSSAKQSISSDGDAPKLSQNSSDNTNTWLNILDNINKFIAARNLKVDILENKRVGHITAFGKPQDIAIIDKYLNGIDIAANTKIHIQAQVLDVIVDQATGKGINWNLISDASSKVQIGNDSGISIDGAGIFSFGSIGGASIDLGKKITLDLLLNLLEKQGRVKVVNQPNITVNNGNKACITTGDEFSFVASIDATPDANGNVTTVSNIERMNVGVDMCVTAKVEDNNQIVVSILPVITSLKSFSTLESGSQTFQTPNIALQKLATQVTVDSGETIHLGGLIADKITDATKGIGQDSMLDFIFRGVQQSFERREIVMLITPTIVN